MGAVTTCQYWIHSHSPGIVFRLSAVEGRHQITQCPAQPPASAFIFTVPGYSRHSEDLGPEFSSADATFKRSLMDSGLVIVTFITFVYIVIMFTLLFYVKYEWCDLLFKNNTESPDCRRMYSKDSFLIGGNSGSIGDINTHRKKKSKELAKHKYS